MKLLMKVKKRKRTVDRNSKPLNTFQCKDVDRISELWSVCSGSILLQVLDISSSVYILTCLNVSFCSTQPGRPCKNWINVKITIVTRSFANAEEPCKHTVSWNRVKCCTNIQRIAFEKACNRWMTSKVIQGHWCCCHLIDNIRFPISLPL